MLDAGTPPAAAAENAAPDQAAAQENQEKKVIAAKAALQGKRTGRRAADSNARRSVGIPPDIPVPDPV